MSSQKDRRELLPENEAIEISESPTGQKQILNAMSNTQSPRNSNNELKEDETKSESKPNIPLPSPTIPKTQPQSPQSPENTERNQSDTTDNGKCLNDQEQNKSVKNTIPLTSALPSPRTQSQPPNTSSEQNNDSKSDIPNNVDTTPQPTDAQNKEPESQSEKNTDDVENEPESELEEVNELPRSNSLKDIKHENPSANFSRCRSSSDSDLTKLHINGLKISTEAQPIKNEIVCDYPFEFVDCIISVLAQCQKLSVFTIRVLSELLIDFVQDRTMKNNGLNDKHYGALQAVWDTVKLQLSEYLPLESVAMETYFIDTFEEEWRSVSQQPRINTLIDNAIRILPPHVFHGTKKKTDKEPETESNQKKEDENTNKDDEINKEDANNQQKKQMDQQQLIRKLERIRKSIHNLLHISRLKTELLGGNVALPFVRRADFKYYYRLQVALSNIAPGCLNCLVLMQSKKRRRVLFSIREPDWLLLFNRMKGRAGFAMIYMAIPIHSIEGVLNKLDPRVVHLSIRSPVRPHDAAIPITSQKNKWSITLFFDSMFGTANNGNNDTKNGSNQQNEPQIGHKDALTALDYITMNRTRVRRKMMTEIQKLVGVEPAVSE